MIVRDEQAGVRRAIESALPYCEKIVIGIDKRSESPERLNELCEELGVDLWFEFGAEDLGMTQEDWEADKIDFAAARNEVRDRITTKWMLTLDSDEVIAEGPPNLEAYLEKARPDADSIPVLIHEDGYTSISSIRLARTDLEWSRGTHNELAVQVREQRPSGLVIKQDRSLRSEEERLRRNLQRRKAMDEMREKGDLSDPWVVFHVAKDVLVRDMVTDATRLVRRYLELTEHQPTYREGRSFLKVSLSAACLRKEKFSDARFWAVEALHEGPRIEAFGMLGTLCEMQGEFYQALAWFQAEASCPQLWHMRWPDIIRTRHERRDTLLRQMTISHMKLSRERVADES